MTQQQPHGGLGRTGQILVRVWVGTGFIVVGLYQVVTAHEYPPGDVRGTPGFWVALGGAASLLGLGMLLSALWKCLKARRER